MMLRQPTEPQKDVAVVLRLYVKCWGKPEKQKDKKVIK
jgi:hypothetical protein